MRQMFPWTMRAQRRREAWADAAYEQQAEHDEALGLLASARCPACPDAAALIPGGMLGEHYETKHPALMNDPMC